MATTATGLMLMPLAPDRCQVCAADHAPEQPHNPDSLYWQMAWAIQHGPGTAPTWADALAHCDEETRQLWTEALREHGIEVG